MPMRCARRELAIVKGKPVGRRGRKATGLKASTRKSETQTAGLPKRESAVISQSLEAPVKSAVVDIGPIAVRGNHVTPLEIHATRGRNAAVARRTRAVKCKDLETGIGRSALV
jgi:hypothetical protein